MSQCLCVVCVMSYVEMTGRIQLFFDTHASFDLYAVS